MSLVWDKETNCVNKIVTSSYYLFKELGPSGLKIFNIFQVKDNIFSTYLYFVLYTLKAQGNCMPVT